MQTQTAMKLNPIAANQTEIEHGNGVTVFFSYKTPVAVFVPGQGALCTTTKYSRTTKERDEARQHADKLAEQLKQCLHTLPLHSSNPVIRQIITESWQTISAYEAAQ